MDRVVGEAVGRVLLEVEPRVAAEQVEDVARAAEVQDQTRAAEGQRGRSPPGLRARILIARVELRADDVVEEVAEAGPAADLVVEIERPVIARERAERAELELMRAQARRSARDRQSRDDECPHGATPHFGAWPYGNNSAPA